jgi:hypothetical protein
MMSATRKDGAPWEETTSVNSPPAVLPAEGKNFRWLQLAMGIVCMAMIALSGRSDLLWDLARGRRFSEASTRAFGCFRPEREAKMPAVGADG